MAQFCSVSRPDPDFGSSAYGLKESLGPQEGGRKGGDRQAGQPCNTMASIHGNDFSCLPPRDLWSLLG